MRFSRRQPGVYCRRDRELIARGSISRDDLTASTTFATIVQLIGMFFQERVCAKTTEKLDFLRWLEHHNHGQLKEFIASNQRLHDEIDASTRPH